VVFVSFVVNLFLIGRACAVELPLLMFLTVSVGLGAGFHLLTNMMFPDASLVRRRISEEFQKDKTGAPRSALFKNLDRLSLDMRTGGMSDLGMAEMPGSTTPSGQPGLRAQLQDMLQQADIACSVPQLVLITLALGTMAAALGFAIHGALLAVVAGAMGMVAPVSYVHMRAKARKEKFLLQLPGAFDLMARVLRSGHSVPQALQAVVESVDQPVAGEFAQCQKQLNLGLRAEISFQDLARRSGIVEMRIFVMALLIQRQVGGNLSDVLERLAMLIRARLKLRNQVRTLTAEGRMQALTLLVLPFVIFGVMLLVNPEYALVLFEHVSLLIAMGVSMLVGTLWIRRIVNFEV
jgi:tight adherence protein B